MHRRVIDRWIEDAEARQVGEWAMAERLPAATAQPPSMMTKLRAMVMPATGQRQVFVPPTERAA